MSNEMEPRRGLGLRTKVVIASIAVLVASTLVSVIAVRQILLTQLRADIERSLDKEVGEFLSVLDAREPDDGEPTDEDLTTVVDLYLAQNIPSEGEEVLAIIDGVPYSSERAHDAGLPLEHLNGEIARWGTLDAPESGELSTPAGELIYVVQPVVGQDGTMGALVIANAPEFERGEIDDVSRTMGLVGVLVVAVGSVLSWFAAGRIVGPIHDLTRTARRISDSDLSRRITVRGSDEVAQLAETFNGMLDRLEESFVLQRRFADDAGHELRTPITIVRGHLELMGDEPRDRTETLTLVMGELDRMNRIVNDLLLLAKAGQPGFVDPRPTDVGTLTREWFVKVSGIADRDWKLDAVADVEAPLDGERITQAILQLSENAAKHAPSGPIGIGSEVRSGSLVLWVRDEGPGIPTGAQERIFDRFARGHGPRNTDGAGLGLAIVRAIAEAHGGTVELESGAGRGATFRLILPQPMTMAIVEPSDEVTV